MNDITIENIISIIAVYANKDSKILPDTPLIINSVIDSINVMQIIADLELLLDKHLGAMDITFDDFESPNTLIKAVQALK